MHSSRKTPVYPGAALGYRVWRVEDNQLRSTGVYDVWEPGLNEAICAIRPWHAAPVSWCSCGFHLLHDPSFIGHVGAGHIVGAVAAKGDVEVHHHGFRAAEVRILALLRPRGRREQRRAQALAERYQVPLASSVEELREIATRHGTEVPEEIRPTWHRTLASVRFDFIKKHVSDRLRTASWLSWGTGMLGLTLALAGSSTGSSNVPLLVGSIVVTSIGVAASLVVLKLIWARHRRLR